MATILPFPLARRRSMIARQARYCLALRAEAAERHIAHQLRTQADAMRRKGIHGNLIARELRSFEGAIRNALRRSTFGASQ